MAKAHQKNRRDRNQTPAPVPTVGGYRRYLQKPAVGALAGAAIIAVCIAAIYGGSLSAPFIFDDNPTIVANTSVHRLWPLVGTPDDPGPLRPTRQSSTAGRPLVNLSFALNYAIDGKWPTGYRVVNVTLHILSTLLLWSIVRRTLRLEYFQGRFDQVAGLLGFLAALLWAVHPLHTESIEYVTQRTELMVGFLYLATLSDSLRYWAATARSSRILWLCVATLACTAGMASKEVMVTAPVVVLLFERTFVAGSFRRALQKSWPLYLGLMASWGLLLALNVGGPRTESTGFGHDVPAYVWWLTQCKALLMYLKLSVWPWPLVIHYQFPLLDTLGAAAPYLLPVLLLAILTVYLLWKRAATGFVLAAVVVILSPTLVVPIITEYAAERRMYLPLAALATLAVVAIYLLAVRIVADAPTLKSRVVPRGRALIVTCVPVALLLLIYSSVSAKRLSVYSETLKVWQDALKYSPESHYVQNNVGMALVGVGRSREAVPYFEEAIRLKPDSSKAFLHLGFALLAANRPNDAAEQFARVLALEPNISSAYDNYGFALTLAGRPQEAIPYIEKARQLDPTSAVPLHNMGVAVAGLNRHEEAAKYFRQALEMNPSFTDAATNLGIAELRCGHPREAVTALERALVLKPDQFESVMPLVAAYDELKQPADAVKTVETALKLARQLRRDELIKQYTEWLRARAKSAAKR
ncbi:MAG TPA: tetratricopeptide repeat protein [Pirellulales bacterium]